MQAEPRTLSDSEFRSTCAHPMQRIDSQGGCPVPFWDYYDRIPEEEFRGSKLAEESVDYVWRRPDGAYEHVLVNTEAKNTFMVIVLDLFKNEVLGHRLLALEEEYGLSSPEEPRGQESAD